MSEYKGIKGFQVTTRTEDPVPYAQALADNPYGGSWASSTNVNSARRSFASLGTATAALMAGGITRTADTELWNGSSWTEVNNLNAAREYTPAVVTNNESWNGSVWTEVNDVNTARAGFGFNGTSTSGLFYGGFSNTTGTHAQTESWDGTSWTELADIATGRQGLGGAGANSLSALAISGYDNSTNVANVEEWSFSGLDPSTTPAADYADAITGDFYYNSTTGQFKQVNAGGAPIGTWASKTNLNTARYLGACRGIASSAIYSTGYTNTNLANVETWDGSSWTETTDVNTARRILAGGGTTTAQLIFGGYISDNTNITESWNGSAWTEVNDMNTSKRSHAGAGTYTAALAATGMTSSQITNVESYNGSSWTEITDVNTARRNPAGGGTQTAMIIYGGSVPPSYVGNTEIWDGSSWTEVSDLNTVRPPAGDGTTTSALAYGGYVGPPGVTGKTEGWDGSSWTELNDMGTARQDLAGAGASNVSSLAVGGYTTTWLANTEEFSAADFEIKTVTTS
jgi:hypothetical protein